MTNPNTEQPSSNGKRQRRYGPDSWTARVSAGLLLFLGISGLAISWAPFHATVQWTLIAHTAIGVVAFGPIAWYCCKHVWEYRHYPISHIVLLGYLGLAALLICLISGAVVTWQGFFAIRSSGFWRTVHFISTFALAGAIVPHALFSFWRVWRDGSASGMWRYTGYAAVFTLAGALPIVLLQSKYSGAKYTNQFPDDYNFLYGTNRPFAPSLAQTDTGGAFDPKSLAGSKSCGTAGCHQQIVQEWLPSAHRYAAMDPAFQGIQDIMAKQNGPESTRYCAGCHDPISLFSGSKNIFVEELTGSHGYDEGVSCLSCHAIRETDVKGNANYTITQPREYLWQWKEDGIGRVARDFLIRTYPDEHNKLSKRAFKKPEYCAACHKQFIDQEVNRVGWVQLQNQYDNWAASHWNHKGDAHKTVECRECHMPLVASTDPAAGDILDYNRSADDAKHRSHRFLGANQMIPGLLELEGGEQHTRLVEDWLQGKLDIPEIRDKWATGPIVKVGIEVPSHVEPGSTIPMRVILGSNKVGHDYPTGPLDIIQSWLEVRVTDDQGREVYSSGTRDPRNFIEPGAFLFKAEPVDQHGNLIDRHNLWEMVGVRYRRALFPGYSDSVQYQIPCPSMVERKPATEPTDPREEQFELPIPQRKGELTVTVRLQYRKIDQFLLNYLMGEDKLTAPVTEIARATATIKVGDVTAAAAQNPDAPNHSAVGEQNTTARAKSENPGVLP